MEQPPSPTYGRAKHCSLRNRSLLNRGSLKRTRSDALLPTGEPVQRCTSPSDHSRSASIPPALTAERDVSDDRAARSRQLATECGTSDAAGNLSDDQAIALLRSLSRRGNPDEHKARAQQNDADALALLRSFSRRGNPGGHKPREQRSDDEAAALLRSFSTRGDPEEQKPRQKRFKATYLRFPAGRFSMDGRFTQPLSNNNAARFMKLASLRQGALSRRQPPSVSSPPKRPRHGELLYSGQHNKNLYSYLNQEGVRGAPRVGPSRPTDSTNQNTQSPPKPSALAAARGSPEGRHSISSDSMELTQHGKQQAACFSAAGVLVRPSSCPSPPRGPLRAAYMLSQRATANRLQALTQAAALDARISTPNNDSYAAANGSNGGRGQGEPSTAPEQCWGCQLFFSPLELFELQNGSVPTTSPQRVGDNMPSELSLGSRGAASRGADASGGGSSIKAGTLERSAPRLHISSPAKDTAGRNAGFTAVTDVSKKFFAELDRSCSMAAENVIAETPPECLAGEYEVDRDATSARGFAGIFESMGGTCGEDAMAELNGMCGDSTPIALGMGDKGFEFGAFDVPGFGRRCGGEAGGLEHWAWPDGNATHSPSKKGSDLRGTAQEVGVSAASSGAHLPCDG